MSAIRYLDLDSTFRNRKEYPNPNDFVVPHNLVRGSTAFTFTDPVLESAPYTGSLIKQPGELVTSASPLPVDPLVIYLDPDEIDINNYYIKNTLQIGSEFRVIVGYEATTKSVVIESAFSVYPPAGTIYYISKVPNYFNTDVDIVESDGNNVSKLSLLSPLVNTKKDFYRGSYVRFTNGDHTGDKGIVTEYKLDSIPVWEQNRAPGSNTYISEYDEIGFLFRPSYTGKISYITIRISCTIFEYYNENRRVLLCRIREGAGLSGEVLYSIPFNIGPISTPRDEILDFSSEQFSLVPSKNYTLTFIDDTQSVIESGSGFINLYGISSTIQYTSYNTDMYPKLAIYMDKDIESCFKQPNTFLYILDNINEEVSAAYSLRLLKSSYTGSSVRVRRSGDNAETDIGFINGGLDVIMLKTFVGENDGYVSIWYDQSGSGNHATQLNITRQPKIVDKGSICIQSMSPCITFDGRDDYLEMTSYPFTSSSSFFISIIAKINNYNSSSYPSSYFYFRDSSSTQFLYSLPYYNQSSLVIQTPLSSTTSISSTIDDLSHVISYIHEGVGNTMYTLLDGELITNSPPTVSISPSTVNGSIRYIGRGEYGLSANFQEMIFYKKAISSPLIQSVVQSQLDYHSIFRPTESYYYRSLDDVSSFNTPVFSIAYDRNDDIVYLGSTNGVITKWDGLSFTSLGGLLDGIVYTIEFDDIHNILYIGGNFTTLTQPDGSVISSQYIAAWNIDTHTWSSLGSGVDSTVYSLKLNKKNNILYVGGSFTSVISGPIVNHIAFWNINTSSWYGLGSGTNSTVRCIEYDEKNQNVYIGGDFTVVDGSISSNRIAAWNENTSSWSAIIIGLDDVCRALKLDLDTNIMYVGGSFTTAGGLPNTTGIASYNTNSLVWSAIGNGCTTPSVYTIELDSGKNLYIGGNFTISSFPGLRRFSKWNGFSWINFFYDNTVYSIKCDRNNNLYIGGQFINCIEQFVVNDTGIQLYDQKYYPLMNGVDGTVRTITSGRYLSVPTVVKNMYVGGQFINAGGIVTNHIALYDESLNKWYPLVDSGTSGVGVDGDVYTSIYIVYGSTRSLYIGGSFATAGGKPINSLARWDEVSSTWNEISPSLHSSSVVYTISKIPVFDNYVYIGGNIPSVNLIPLNNIVKYSYDTNTWSPLVDTDTLVSGVNGTVFSCELYTSNLYISGDFTSAGGKPISHFARWDELEQKWYDVNDINTGLSVENVNCICGNEFTGQIYVGGSFTSAGGNVANYIAKWNTVLNTWSPLIDSNTGINGLNGPVHSIQINLGVLYITGSFTQAGGLPVNNTVRYDVDTSEFLSVGNGVSNSTSNSVAYTQLIRVIGTSMEPDIMYIGGQFDQFVLNNDDITTNNIAKVSFYNFSNIRF